MSPFGSSVLSFILIALGMIAVILSFLVPDRKKSMIALLLAGLIVLTGFIELGSDSFTRWRWNRRMREIQRDRQVDLDQLRDKFKAQTGALPPPAVPTPKKK